MRLGIIDADAAQRFRAKLQARQMPETPGHPDNEGRDTRHDAAQSRPFKTHAASELHQWLFRLAVEPGGCWNVSLFDHTPGVS
jgi:hypothetical protein